MLTRSGCLGRQDRLRSRLSDAELDGAIVSDPRDVYYFTGLLPAQFPALLLVKSTGPTMLFASDPDAAMATDEAVTFETNKLYTLNPDPVACLANAVEASLRGRGQVRRLGWQAEALQRQIGDLIAHTLRPEEWLPIDAWLIDMQECKDSDEIELLRAVNRVNLAAYAAAQATIAPGVRELEVLTAAFTGATLAAGEVITLGGDYRSGAFGGPARNRAIEAGELYIIDSGVSYRGYWSDLARTFAVGPPTDLQVSVYTHVAGVLGAVAGQLRPGVDGQAVWRWMDEQLREHPYLRTKGLVTHGGHGIGVRVHEMPDINRDRGGLLRVGNVVTCEPGGYGPELGGGIRLENAFLITADGAENLSPYPLSLT